MFKTGIDDKKLLRAFLEEAEELLDKLGSALLELEKNQQSAELIHEVFRLTHSIKSESALVGFANLSEVAHKIEDLFEMIKSGQRILDKPLMDRILAGSDLITEMIARISRGESDADIDASSFIAELEALAGRPPSTAARPSPRWEAVEETAVSFSPFETVQIQEARERGEPLYRLTYRVAAEEPMKYSRAYLVFSNLEMLASVIKTVPDMAEAAEDDNLYGRVSVFLTGPLSEAEILKACDVDQIEGLELSTLRYPSASTASTPKGEGQEARAPEAEQARRANGDQASEEPKVEREPAKAAIERSSIRVETRKLNDLWQLMGELVICKAHLAKLQETYEEKAQSGQLKEELESTVDFLGRISSGIQQAMMETRMVPISVLFNKFPRLVRDLSRKLGKEVELKLFGEDTEIDRSIIEVLSDPLTHIIRNSLDHGIEPVAERLRKGKRGGGAITMSAHQRGGKIVIEIDDDGHGLDVEKIRAKAGAGLEVSDEEVIKNIFKPGFSTKDEVTELSGRGVGMDVVATRIKEDLKGEVLLQSRKDQGMHLTILLPLTLTILHSLVVRGGGSYFAIPIRDIDETLKVSADAGGKLDHPEGALKLLRLDALLAGSPSSEGSGKEESYGVIIQQKGRRVCLLVDELVNEEDVVIKPIDDILNIKGLFSGVSVLGDGRMLFILDTARIMEVLP